jgi:hypothetical protein
VYCQDFVILHHILELPRSRSVQKAHLTRDVVASALDDRYMYQADTIETECVFNVDVVELRLAGC